MPEGKRALRNGAHEAGEFGEHLRGAVQACGRRNVAVQGDLFEGAKLNAVVRVTGNRNLVTHLVSDIFIFTFFFRL